MINTLTEYLIIRAKMEDEMNYPNMIYADKCGFWSELTPEADEIYKVGKYIHCSKVPISCGGTMDSPQQHYIHEAKVDKLEQSALSWAKIAGQNQHQIEVLAEKIVELESFIVYIWNKAPTFAEMDNALTLKDGKIAELEHRCIQAEELNSSNWKEIKLLKQRIAELEKSLELINNHHLEHHEDINAALQQAYDRCADLESELRRALDVVCVEPVMSAPCNRCGVHKYGFCGGCKHKENMNTVLKSGDAEVQCPIKGLCQTQNPINIDQAENQSNTKTFVHSWEQSLKRRKRAPETVGGKDESH